MRLTDRRPQSTVGQHLHNWERIEVEKKREVWRCTICSKEIHVPLGSCPTENRYRWRDFMTGRP